MQEDLVFADLTRYKSNEITNQQFSDLIRLIADEFSTPHYAGHNYSFTQYLAGQFMDMGFDGVIFGSSLDSKGENFVFFYPKDCIAINSRLFMVDDISFSVCTAEVTMSASSEDTSVKINAEKSLVEGKCGSEITLSLATGMADVIFDDPQYLWYVKGAGDSDFRLLNYNVNKTKIDTMITAWTEYYAVVTANIYDKHAYIDGNLSKCTPVAISNTYTVLCAPSMDAYLASQNCNKVLIGATVYDAAFDEIGAWWEKSTDGKNWQKIPRAVYHDTLRYEITEDTYFRLTNSKISSPATEKVLYRGISLTAEPSYGLYGTDVKLTAVTSNFGDMPNGPWYNWQRFEYSDEDWRQIDVDGHSKDNTLEIVKEFAGERQIIKSEKDNGIYDAFNKGIMLAKGKILVSPWKRILHEVLCF